MLICGQGVPSKSMKSKPPQFLMPPHYAFIESLWILMTPYLYVLTFVDTCPGGRSVLAECTQGQTFLGKHYSSEQVGRLNTYKWL